MRGVWPVLALLGCFAGCANIEDISRENYRRGFLIDHPLTRESVAVLPMWGKGDPRSYLPSAEGIFVNALKEMRPQIRLLAPSETRRTILEKGVDGAYRSTEEAFISRRVVREEDIRRLGQSLNVRFLLETDLDRVEVTEGATLVRIRGQLWDAQTGDVVWEGTGEGTGYLFLVFPQTPASFEKTVEVASRGLIRRLP